MMTSEKRIKKNNNKEISVKIIVQQEKINVEKYMTLTWEKMFKKITKTKSR